MAKIYTRSNSPYWWTRYNDPNGADVRCSLKIPKEAGYKALAQLKASEIEMDHWNDWKEGKLEKPLFTFEQLMVGWIRETNPGSADLTNIKSLREVFGGRIINTLAGTDIADCKRKWREDGLANNTIRRRLSTLSSALSYARAEWEWDIENVVRGRLPAEEVFEADPLTYEQAQVFVDALQKRGYQPYNAPHLFDFFILAIHTGMRKSEILGCRLDQVDFENRCIHLKSHQQKGKKRTATPLNLEALEAIKRRYAYISKHYPETIWLFPNVKTKGESNIKDIKTSFDTLRKEVGCPDVRPHDLRHTFASWLVQRGTSLYQVSKALRHGSVKPTQRYAHLELEHLRQTHDLVGLVPVDFDRKSNPDDSSVLEAKRQWQERLARK
jgi:integrase